LSIPSFFRLLIRRELCRTAQQPQGVFIPPSNWNGVHYNYLSAETGAEFKVDQPVPPLTSTELAAFELAGKYEGLELICLDLGRAVVDIEGIA
jgi:hypothetical protein